jgi:hypothetical protein
MDGTLQSMMPPSMPPNQKQRMKYNKGNQEWNGMITGEKVNVITRKAK